MGLGDCFGIDARVSKAVHAPILKLDLLTRSGQDSLFALLNLHTVVAVHVSPPCRTTCRSQDKERPLRSEAHPAGVPDLQPQQLVSVQEANTLISFCASLAAHCQRCGILFSCEHPARSFMWEVPEWRAAVAPLNLLSTSWHQCMYGAALDVFTQVQHNIPGFSCLAARCSKNHKHILAPVTKLSGVGRVLAASFDFAWGHRSSQVSRRHYRFSGSGGHGACAAAQGAPYATNGPRVPYGCPCFRTCLCLTRRP